MEIKYTSICDIGKYRNENQDDIFARTGDCWGIFVIADGMGGHSNGAWASRKITTAFAEWIEKVKAYVLQYNTSVLFSELRRILSNVNDEIFRNTAKGEVCGSTVIALLIIKNSFILLSAGDSRCYELQKHRLKSTLRQLSIDEICKFQGENYGKLINAVGTRTPLRCNLISGALKKKTAFLLCSDGVYKLCSDKELLVIMKHSERGMERVGEEIKNTIYQRGAKDNFSAIVVKVFL